MDRSKKITRLSSFDMYTSPMLKEEQETRVVEDEPSGLGVGEYHY
jgi:hypothetical protein